LTNAFELTSALASIISSLKGLKQVSHSWFGLWEGRSVKHSKHHGNCNYKDARHVSIFSL